VIRGIGSSAPIPAVEVIEVKRGKSTLFGYSGFVLGMTLVAPFRPFAGAAVKPLNLTFKQNLARSLSRWIGRLF
jgi:hypothetical protein